MARDLDPQTPNLLLRTIGQENPSLLDLGLERYLVKAREVICEPGEALPFVYFPITCMFSSIVVLGDGTAVEAATIGCEGMAGVAILVGERKSPYRVIQQVEGQALRMDANRFADMLQQNSSLRLLITRYVFTLLEQCGQNAGCNLHHPIESRLARWLLQTSDRAGRNHFYLTQEFLSEMVGASRQTISGVAGKLQEQGLIEYSRGNISIINRVGLEAQACPCYEMYNSTYEKYMHMPIEKPA